VVVGMVAERVEIGGDGGAFFSDLKFGFLLMHYIRENVTTSLSFSSSSSSFTSTVSVTVSVSFNVCVNRKKREEEGRRK